MGYVGRARGNKVKDDRVAVGRCLVGLSIDELVDMGRHSYGGDF